MLDFKELKKTLESEMKNASTEDVELEGTLDVDFVEVPEGYLVKFGEDLILDPEVVVSYVKELSAFEEEFGALPEVAEKLRVLKRVEESLGPLEELEESINLIKEQTEKLLEDLQGDKLSEKREGCGCKDKKVEEDLHHLEDDEVEDVEELMEEPLDDEEYEEVDLKDLTVKELLLLVLSSLLADEGAEDSDVDLEDLDLENIGDMKFSDLLRAIAESKDKEEKEDDEEEPVASLFEPEVVGELPNQKEVSEKDHEVEEEEHEEERMQEVEEKEDDMKEADEGYAIFKRILDRLGKF